MSLRPARGADARESFVVKVRDRNGLRLHTTDYSTGASAVGEPRLASVLAAGGAHLRARGLGAATGGKATGPPPDYTQKGGGYYTDKKKLDDDMKANVTTWEKKRKEFQDVMKAEGDLAKKAVNEYKSSVDARLEDMRSKMQTLQELLKEAEQGASATDIATKKSEARISALLTEKQALEAGQKAAIDAAVAEVGLQASQKALKLQEEITELKRQAAKAEKADVAEKAQVTALTKSKQALEAEKAQLDIKLKELEKKLGQIATLAGCWFGEKLDTDPKAKKQ